MAKPVKTQDTELGNQNSECIIHKRVPFWMLIIGWAAMLIFTFHACTHMVAAGDTWVAMACGRHFLEHGVSTVEPFSANSHKPGPTPEEVATWPGWAQWITEKVGIETVKKWHPTGWINQNWLTHIIFYKLVPASTYADGLSFTSNALVYWKFAIYIIAVICVYYTCRLLGVHPALAAIFCCFSMFIGRSFLDIRPAGFSNMLVAVLLLILAIVTYRNILYIWLIVPVAVFWCNVHGGYIYMFIILVPFIGLHLLICCNNKLTAILYNIVAWLFLIFVFSLAGLTFSTFLFAVLLVILDFVLIFYKNNLVSIGWKGVYHTIAAYIIAFIAMIIFNPFHLTNLTHTFIISVSEHAARWREIHEWQSAFDWQNPVGTAVPFLVMLILALAALFTWIFALKRSSNLLQQYRKKRVRSFEDINQRKIDLALMIVAALTIYMAVRSRRFIPIAGIVGCPVVAMLINEIIRWFSASNNLQRQKGFVISPMPEWLKSYIAITGVVTVLIFGTWWGLKFKRIYLDPWPNDYKYTSVFMRMTASDAKPFYAMKFIRDNNISGKMFNYWTEGGFIAWGQTPDPNTGKTPLQLFMDGRAQAAYNRDTFDEWSIIMAGGLLTNEKLNAARIRGKELTSQDYREIGQWMSEQLTKRNVWVVLMPSAVFNDPQKPNSYHAVRGLEMDPNWPIVFSDDGQKLYVNISTPQGKKLFDGIFNSSTIYPDDYHTNLNLSHNWLYYRPGEDQKKIGFDFAVKAFNENPAPAAMLKIILIASTFDYLSADIEQFCREYLKKFSENKSQWAKQDGYRMKVESARWASLYLEQTALEQNDQALKDFCAKIGDQCFSELVQMTIGKNW
jgi:hypothetical protein